MAHSLTGGRESKGSRHRLALTGRGRGGGLAATAGGSRGRGPALHVAASACGRFCLFVPMARALFGADAWSPRVGQHTDPGVSQVKALSAHLSLVTKASRRVLAAKEEELQTLRQQMLARGADLDVGTAGEHCAEGGIRGGVDVACGQSPGATAASCGRMGEEPVPGSPGCSKEQLIAFIRCVVRAELGSSRLAVLPLVPASACPGR